MGLTFQGGDDGRDTEASPGAQTRNPASPAVVVLEVQRLAMRNYNYIIVDPSGRECVIVDPAWEMDTIVHAVGRIGAHLRHVLLTHSHPDHVDLARQVSDHFGCPVHMSAEEIESSGFDLPRLRPLQGAWPVGGMLIEPILTPGHTPGSVCYRIGKNLFSGDALFAEGCGLCPSNQAAYRMFESLSDLKRRISADTRIFPGHSFGKAPGQPMHQVLKDNMYLHFKDPEMFVSFRMRPGQSMKRLFGFR